MPKRKLADVAPRSRNPQTTALTTTFTNGVQTLSRALRTARGFERQKLGRREQKAKSEKNDNALTKVREEIEALKVPTYLPVLALEDG